MPLMVAFTVGLVALVRVIENNCAPVGYVDHAGLLGQPISAPLDDPSEQPVPMIPYQTEADARKALEAKDIQAYYVLDADYMTSKRVELVYIKKPSDNARAQWRDFMQVNLLAGFPSEIARRATEGSDLVIRSPDGKREFAGGPSLGQVMPVFVGLAFVILILISSGTLMDAVIVEKQNRTMEMLVTSVSPAQLMTGKVLGIVAMSLTQVVAWIAFAALAVFVGGNYFGVEWLQDVSVDPRTTLMLLAVLLPAYVMMAAVMTAVGSTVIEAQEGQQVSGLLAMPVWIPVWLAMLILENPNSPLAIGMSLFPVTAPLTVAIRLVLTDVPVWQMALSSLILILCALAALWLAGRAFRLGMLRYGQRLNWRELFGGARPQPLAGGDHE